MKKGYVFSLLSIFSCCSFSLMAEEDGPKKSKLLQHAADFAGQRLMKKKENQKKTYKRVIKHRHVQNAPHDWGWGTRVGVWHTPSSVEWDFAALYTRLHTKPFENTKTETGRLLPIWKEAASSETTWQLYLDLADVEVGRKFHVKKNMFFRPHAGLRGAWIYQKCKLPVMKTERGVPKGPAPDFIGGRCGGIGVRSGLDSLWEMGKGCSFFSDGALSALASYQPNTGGEQVETMERKQERLSKGILLAEAVFGFQYATRVLRKEFLTCSLGYEMNYIFNRSRFMDELNPLQKLYPQAVQSVSVQGVSLMFRLDF